MQSTKNATQKPCRSKSAKSGSTRKAHSFSEFQSTLDNSTSFHRQEQEAPGWKSFRISLFHKVFFLMP